MSTLTAVKFPLIRNYYGIIACAIFRPFVDFWEKRAARFTLKWAASE